MDADTNAALRTQRQNRQQLDFVIRIEREPKALPNRRQQQNDLHHREVVSNALAWTTAEREVSILRQLFSALPTLRFKRVRLIEKTRIPMRHPLKRKNLHSFRHAITADLSLLDRFTTNRVSRRIESHRFLRDHLRVLQLRQIRYRRRPASKHFIELRMKLLLRLPVLCQ